MCVSVLFTELHEHTPYCFCFGTNVYCLPTKYIGDFNLLQGLHSIAPPRFVHVSLSISELHEHTILCCGANRVLFTNKVSEYWFHIIKPYLFTKFHTPKHLGKRVT